MNLQLLQANAHQAMFQFQRKKRNLTLRSTIIQHLQLLLSRKQYLGKYLGIFNKQFFKYFAQPINPKLLNIFYTLILILSKRGLKLKSKSQASLEFLTTYAWAFLAIMIALGALYYFGVLDFAKFLPQECSFPSQFECNAFAFAGSSPAGEIRFNLVTISARL